MEELNIDINEINRYIEALEIEVDRLELERRTRQRQIDRLRNVRERFDQAQNAIANENEYDERNSSKDSDKERIVDRNRERIELGARVRSVTKGRYRNREGVIVQIEGNTVFFKDQDSIVQQRLVHNVIVITKKVNK